MKQVSLQVKIVGALAAMFFVVISSIIFINARDQRSTITAEVNNSAREMADAVFNSILHPMTVGDSETIREQMADFEANVKNAKVFIFGIDRVNAFASEKALINTDMNKSTDSKELAADIDQVLQTGRTSGRPYEEVLGGKRYLTVMRPLMNDNRCHHCHGSARPVLGAILVRQNIDAVTSNLASLRNKNILIGVLGLAVVVGALIFLISLLVVRPVNTIIDDLSQSAQEVTMAASQISATSQSLAEASTEQAAGVEETSASMEEIAAMTHQNTDNAQQAKAFATEAWQLINTADQSMGTLMTSMQEISDAGEQTGKIIKTIDEIAFQTNLLALNAAVEAARAGEAGAGFAVVADEVRSLALRAAEAAGNTSSLIEGTIDKVRNGHEQVQKTGHAFKEVGVSSGKVLELINEIAEASTEQSQGIRQINTATQEMDQTIQTNAANAEESAAAAEQLNAQAEQLRMFVGKLAEMVTGKSAHDIVKI